MMRLSSKRLLCVLLLATCKGGPAALREPGRAGGPCSAAAGVQDDRGLMCDQLTCCSSPSTPTCMDMRALADRETLQQRLHEAVAGPKP